MTTSKTMLRIAISLSVVWIAAAYFLAEESTRLRWFLLLGVLPVLIAWAVRWVVLADRRDKQRQKRPYRFRLTWWK